MRAFDSFSAVRAACTFVFVFVCTMRTRADFLRFGSVHFCACAHAIFTVVFRILNSSRFFSAAAALSDSSFEMQNVKLQPTHIYRVLTVRVKESKGVESHIFFFLPLKKAPPTLTSAQRVDESARVWYARRAYRHIHITLVLQQKIIANISN